MLQRPGPQKSYSQKSLQAFASHQVTQEKFFEQPQAAAMTTPNFFKLGKISEKKSRKTSALVKSHQKPPLSQSNFFTVVPKKLKLHSRIL